MYYRRRRNCRFYGKTTALYEMSGFIIGLMVFTAWVIKNVIEGAVALVKFIIWVVQKIRNRGVQYE